MPSVCVSAPLVGACERTADPLDRVDIDFPLIWLLTIFLASADRSNPAIEARLGFNALRGIWLQGVKSAKRSEDGEYRESGESQRST